MLRIKEIQGLKVGRLAGLKVGRNRQKSKTLWVSSRVFCAKSVEVVEMGRDEVFALGEEREKEWRTEGERRARMRRKNGHGDQTCGRIARIG